MIEYVEKDSAITFRVRVVPRASRSEIVGEHDGALRVRIAATPVEGAANDELLRLLASQFKIPRSAISIVSGHSGKLKKISLSGVSSSAFAEVLQSTRQ